MFRLDVYNVQMQNDAQSLLYLIYLFPDKINPYIYCLILPGYQKRLCFIFYFLLFELSLRLLSGIGEY